MRYLEERIPIIKAVNYRYAGDREYACEHTVQALGKALALKDTETTDHSKRVTAYSILLAKSLDLPCQQVTEIGRGAFLHDIGKIAVPDYILNKPAKLDPDELVIMRQHCMSGYQILSSIPYLKQAALIALCHHEFFDGTGYPNGLSGEHIPIGARIFSVADALDAITTDRPYRSASSFDAARSEILRNCGTQFDPSVVYAFLRMTSGMWDELRFELTKSFQLM